MGSLKQFSEREFKRILKSNNYYLVRVKGSHHIYRNDSGREIAVPKGEPNKMMARRLIKENNLILSA